MVARTGVWCTLATFSGFPAAGDEADRKLNTFRNVGSSLDIKFT